MAETRSRRKAPGGASRASRAKQPKPESETEGGRGGAICPVAFCPVGMTLAMADQLRPEVVEHLMAAGRELLLAVKAVIDARVEGMGGANPLERIDIG